MELSLNILIPAVIIFLLNFLKFCCSAGLPPMASRSVNVNPQLVKWPGKRVPYYIDASYPASVKQLIRDSAKQVSADVKGCVTFVEVPSTVKEYKVFITNRKPDGTRATRCSAWPGLYADARKRGLKEQRVFVTDGPTGCQDGSKHSIMKFFAITLGKLNEHQRADRDEYIKVNHANMLQDPEEAYRIHESTSEVNFYPYDYCSITHNQPEEFAKPKTEAFIVKHEPKYIPKLNHLSEIDCKEISEMYDCDPNKCEAMNCEDLDGVSRIPSEETEATEATTAEVATEAPTTAKPTVPTTTEEAFPTEPEPDIPAGPTEDYPDTPDVTQKPPSANEPPLEISGFKKKLPKKST
ncbi:low choriolytic enzyme-like [Paramacrobiotus metropolitanus]|uniref:low choriolytic enzyme-like n=1 Tax=Paramacrobiotus metropolitanus TaxID=2943436 RepID=UPI002445F3FE|nr:low choriolytic enzyme-like [Paramacrobiotus metropolitanus]